MFREKKTIKLFFKETKPNRRRKEIIQLETKTDGTFILKKRKQEFKFLFRKKKKTNNQK